MTITETIERQCCDERKGDLKVYNGDRLDLDKRWKIFFCMHCGQAWIEEQRMGGAGSSETFLRKLYIAP